MTLPTAIEAFDVVLRDGSTVHLRPAQPADETAVRSMFSRLSTESLYSRFFRIPKLPHLDVSGLLHADPEKAFTLVAESRGEACALAGYSRDPHVPARAEVAFVTGDALQGRGIGTRMLETLADIARVHRIRRFDAYVLANNDRMMRVFVDSGFAIDQQLEAGVFHVVLDLDRTSEFEARAAARSETAATASVQAFLAPRSVAVIGASRERGKIGSEILHNLVSAGFTGRLFVVHPSAAAIDGVPAVRRLDEIPGDIDLAVICVPASHVSGVVDDCIAKRVRALVIISAGFGETGAEGRALEASIVARIREAGIRLVGPNCMGVLNTAPDVRLNATFAPVYPPAGRVAMSTQSGALGLAVLDYARDLGIGLSTFVSVGNKADVSSNDLIQYWVNDPNTGVILLYVESFGNPRKFSQIARRVGRRKPIVAVKSGRSAAGARAASSHTGALASSDAIVDALFRQSGVIRTNTLEEMFDVARLLATQPLPQGHRVGILTNAGGPGILAADACEASGLTLPPLSNASVASLRSFLPAAAAIGNPVDMIASATADQYERALATLLDDEAVDSVLVIFIPPLVTKGEDVAAADQTRDHVAAGQTRARHLHVGPVGRPDAGSDSLFQFSGSGGRRARPGRDVRRLATTAGSRPGDLRRRRSRWRACDRRSRPAARRRLADARRRPGAPVGRPDSRGSQSQRHERGRRGRGRRSDRLSGRPQSDRSDDPPQDRSRRRAAPAADGRRRAQRVARPDTPARRRDDGRARAGNGRGRRRDARRRRRGSDVRTRSSRARPAARWPSSWPTCSSGCIR